MIRNNHWGSAHESAQLKEAPRGEKVLMKVGRLLMGENTGALVLVGKKGWSSGGERIQHQKNKSKGTEVFELKTLVIK